MKLSALMFPSVTQFVEYTEMFYLVADLKMLLWINCSNE